MQHKKAKKGVGQNKNFGEYYPSENDAVEPKGRVRQRQSQPTRFYAASKSCRCAQSPSQRLHAFLSLNLIKNRTSDASFELLTIIENKQPPFHDSTIPCSCLTCFSLTRPNPEAYCARLLAHYKRVRTDVERYPRKASEGKVNKAHEGLSLNCILNRKSVSIGSK